MEDVACLLCKKKAKQLFAQLSRVPPRLKTTVHKIIVDAKFHNTLYCVLLAQWHKRQVLGQDADWRVKWGWRLALLLISMGLDENWLAFYSTVAGQGHRVCVAHSVFTVWECGTRSDGDWNCESTMKINAKKHHQRPLLCHLGKVSWAIEREAPMGVANQTDWDKWTASCQAVTSQATPLSQPRGTLPPQSQILNHSACACVFHVCVCVHICTCTHTCLFSSTQVKQLKWFMLERDVVCSKSFSFFKSVPKSTISRMMESLHTTGKESCTVKHKLTHESFCVIPGIPLCSAGGWGPEHQAGPAIQTHIKKRIRPYQREQVRFLLVNDGLCKTT